MTAPLAGKVAIVTGSSRGIGKAIALQLGADGTRVVVCARTEQSSEELPGSIGETAQVIRAAGGEALALQLDVTVDAELHAVVDQTVSEFGRIDILVNNAGMLGGGGPFLGGDPALIDGFYRTNLRAPYVLSQIAGRRLAEQGGGVIFNISSGLARLPAPPSPGAPGRGPHFGGPGSVYGATKAALDRFAAGVAPELLERKIAIINIYPGFTLTETMARRLPPSVDTSRMERPETAARAVAFLSRDPLPHTGRIIVAREFVAEHGL
jgi:NAD(P)-dependent dehydrogenase (short-subunit alcohol dehydrogenase family)